MTSKIIALTVIAFTIGAMIGSLASDIAPITTMKQATKAHFTGTPTNILNAAAQTGTLHIETLRKLLSSTASILLQLHTLLQTKLQESLEPARTGMVPLSPIPSPPFEKPPQLEPVTDTETRQKTNPPLKQQTQTTDTSHPPPETSTQTSTPTEQPLRPPSGITLIGAAWDHTDITILVTPKRSIKGWSETYVPAVGFAVNDWRQAIATYSIRSERPYLNKLTFLVYVSGVNSTTRYDITVTWASSLGEYSEAGVTNLTYLPGRRISKAQITLTTAMFGYRISSSSMRTIASHELGHALGLDHSTISSDLMYSVANLRNTGYPSELDLNALSVVYAWLSKETFYPPQSLTS